MDRSVNVKEKKRLESDEKIFRAAISVFGQKGFGDATIAEIAAESGVTQGLISQRFASKTELMCKTLEFADSVYKLFSFAHDTLPEALLDLLNIMKVSLRSNSDIFRFFAVLSKDVGIPDEVRELQRKLFYAGTLCKAMVEAQSDGRLAPGDPYLLYSIFLSNAGNLIASYSRAGLPLPDDSSFLSAIQYQTATKKERELIMGDTENLLARAAGTVYPVGIFSNLTRGTMKLKIDDTELEMPAEELMSITRNTIPDEKQAEEFSALFNREHLLSAYESGEKSVSFRHNFSSPDGEIHWVDTTAVFVPREGGEVSCVALIRFVDEEMKYQSELEKAMSEAKEANSAKSRFLFNMSHDLRTPINAILGYTELMERYDSDPEKRSAYRANIRIAGSYLLELISGILELSRIESGTDTVNMSVIDCDEFKKSVKIVFAQEYSKKNLKVSTDIVMEHRRVLSDSLKCRQIILNILSNAVKYTPSGGSINITGRELKGTDDKHILLRLIVEDTGIGMSPEFLPHLFDSFIREHSSTELPVPGSGLGMGIVKKLVTLLGGTVSAESEQGKGTRITLELPFELADSVQESLPYDAIQDINYSGLSVLLAEDNALNSEITGEFLSAEGISVSYAHNGLECLNMVKAAEKPFDLILMDVQMPVMDGYRATREIRALTGAAAATPVIAITANVFDEDLRRAYDSGMNGFCAKPIDSNTLLNEIARVLSLSAN